MDRVDGELAMKRICPSCYRRNGAWVLYAKCPFCGSKGKPIPEIVGPEWPAKLRDMLLETETDLIGTYTLQHARRGLLPIVADLGTYTLQHAREGILPTDADPGLDTRTRNEKGPRPAQEAAQEAGM